MKNNPTTRKTIALFWHHAWKYPGLFIGEFVSMVLTVLIFNFVPPLILANVLNRLSRHDYQPHNIWASFGPELVAYALLILSGGAIAWRIIDYFGWRLEGNVERDMAQRVFSHLLKQSASFHANTFGGSLVSQTTKLLGAYIRVHDTTLFQLTQLLSSLLFAAVILAFRVPLYSIVMLVFAIFFIVVAFFVSRTIRELSARHAGRETIQTGHIADSITNVMAIKSFAGQDYEQKRFNKAAERTREALLEFSRGNQKQQIYFTAITNSATALSLFIAVISVMVFNNNIATVFLILNYTAIIAGQLWNFGTNSLRTYNRAFGDARDMTEILELEPEIKDPAHPEKLAIHRGQITLKNVTFTHEGVDETLFKKLNISIKPGEKVGLVGHSGSGKTTFTRILLRFSDIDSGEILIDGQNIAKITQDDLHRSIAYVPQEPIMFHRSLRDNIRYGDFNASEEEVIGVAKAAHAHEFIEQLPDGYETLVGERGVKLSGGQRQRIAIARALLKNAPILVLDEATSALDSESEALIQDALWKLMERRTAIVIAHRLSTIQKMDRIIVMDKGKIVEQGTHKELIRAGGQYADLWARQSGGFMDD